MKYFALAIVFVTLSLNALVAQKLQPVTWTFEIENVEADTYVLVATASMKDNWVIYSQSTDPDGPVATSFEWEESNIQLVGDVKEVSPVISNYSELFEVQVVKFKQEAVFKQQFIANGHKPVVRGSVTYMTCDSQRCLPPTTVAIEVTL